MKIHRFFVDQELPEIGQVKINDVDLAHQLRHVLRFQVGHKLILLDNSGKEFHSHIVSISSRDVLVEIYLCKKIKQEDLGGSGLKIHLFMALSKRNSFEWILEKGTELGVATFTPIQSERSEKKDLNMTRSRKIVRESAEQSERTTLPEIKDTLSLQDFFENQLSHDVPTNVFVLDPRGKKLEQKNLQEFLGSESVGVFIGPEGGWSEKEIELFEKNSLPIYSFGKNILRAETAAISCISLLALTPNK